MPELLVRNVEAAVVNRLREEANREGVSVEEAHRRLLRRTLLNGQEAPLSFFKEHLLDLPDWDNEFNVFFERSREMPRPVDLD